MYATVSPTSDRATGCTKKMVLSDVLCCRFFHRHARKYFFNIHQYIFAAWYFITHLQQHNWFKYMIDNTLFWSIIVFSWLPVLCLPWLFVCDPIDICPHCPVIPYSKPHPSGLASLYRDGGVPRKLKYIIYIKYSESSWPDGSNNTSLASLYVYPEPRNHHLKTQKLTGARTRQKHLGLFFSALNINCSAQDRPSKYFIKILFGEIGIGVPSGVLAGETSAQAPERLV